MSTKEITSSHIIKLLKDKGKEKILGGTSRNVHITHKRTMVQVMDDFFKNQKQWQLENNGIVLKVLKRKQK